MSNSDQHIIDHHRSSAWSNKPEARPVQCCKGTPPRGPRLVRAAWFSLLCQAVWQERGQQLEQLKVGCAIGGSRVQKWAWVKTWSPGPPCSLTSPVCKPRYPGFDPQPNRFQIHECCFGKKAFTDHSALLPSSVQILRTFKRWPTWALRDGQHGREMPSIHCKVMSSTQHKCMQCPPM